MSKSPANPSLFSKFALRVAAVAVLAFIVMNSVLAVRHLGLVRESARRVRDAAVLQANITAVLLDLSEIEAGQRGYILTNNSDYLKPYDEAKAKLTSDFASLKTRLTEAGDRDAASQLEQVAAQKIAEAERTIDLRRRSFRKRAFDMVDTNEGKRLMDEARVEVLKLSAAAAAELAEQEHATTANIQQARTTSVLANLGLLVLTALVFAGFHFYTHKLERAVEERTLALGA